MHGTAVSRFASLPPLATCWVEAHSPIADQRPTEELLRRDRTALSYYAFALRCQHCAPREDFLYVVKGAASGRADAAAAGGRYAAVLAPASQPALARLAR
jgi:hypothetical protein